MVVAGGLRDPPEGLFKSWLEPLHAIGITVVTLAGNFLFDTQYLVSHHFHQLHAQ